MKIAKRCCLAIVAFIFSISLHPIRVSHAAVNNMIYIDAPNSSFNAFFPSDNGKFYLLGMDNDDSVNWLALVSPDGKMEWKMSYDDTAIYRDLLLIDGEPTLYVAKSGVPNRPYEHNDPEMTSYFLPISSSGIAQTPIMLPDWTPRSYIFQSDHGILLYGETYSGGYDSLNAVMYDKDFCKLWDFSISGDKMPFDFCQDVIQTYDGFLLYGPNDEQQSLGIVKCSFDGAYQWGRTYPINASVHSLAIFNSTLTLLAARWEANDYVLFTLDEDGAILWEKTLVNADSNITLRQIIPFENGCIIVGHKSYGDGEKRFLFLQTLDSQLNIRDEIDMTDINVPMLQVKYAQDERLYIAGMNGEGNDLHTWRIAYLVFDETDIWFARVK